MSGAQSQSPVGAGGQRPTRGSAGRSKRSLSPCRSLPCSPGWGCRRRGQAGWKGRARHGAALFPALAMIRAAGQGAAAGWRGFPFRCAPSHVTLSRVYLTPGGSSRDSTARRVRPGLITRPIDHCRGVPNLTLRAALLGADSRSTRVRAHRRAGAESDLFRELTPASTCCPSVHSRRFRTFAPHDFRASRFGRRCGSLQAKGSAHHSRMRQWRGRSASHIGCSTAASPRRGVARRASRYPRGARRRRADRRVAGSALDGRRARREADGM